MRYRHARPSHVWAAVLFAAFLFAAAAEPTRAAMFVRIALDPSSPAVGEPIVVSVLTVSLAGRDGRACIGDAGATPTPRQRDEWRMSDGRPLELRMAAFGPGGAEIPVALTPRPSDTAYWDGSVVFSVPGRWTLRMTSPDWSNAAECGGAEADVDVAPARLPGSGGFSLALLAIAAGVAIGAGVVLPRRVPERV